MKTLVISDGGALADETVKELRACGSEPLVLRDPNDKAIQRALETPVERVAVVARDDIVALTMLLTIAFAAMFTAGLVQRLIDPRLTTIIGRRSIPMHGHVIVIGLGQVGLRLCSLLRDSGIAAVAVEVSEEAPNVRLARGYGIPVVIGHGEDREVLRRVHVDRARALAAVTSSDLTNVEVAVAARAARDSLEIVVRVRQGDVADETQTLVGLGHMRDIYEFAGVSLAGILSSA